MVWGCFGLINKVFVVVEIVFISSSFLTRFYKGARCTRRRGGRRRRRRSRRNPAQRCEGGEQIREFRRFFAGKILGALPCVQDAPGLWIFPARMYIEHGPDASDTTASHTFRRSLQNHCRTRPGCYHSQESARISVIAMVIIANEGGTSVAPKNRVLARAA